MINDRLSFPLADRRFFSEAELSRFDQLSAASQIQEFHELWRERFRERNSIAQLGEKLVVAKPKAVASVRARCLTSLRTGKRRLPAIFLLTTPQLFNSSIPEKILKNAELSVEAVIYFCVAETKKLPIDQLEDRLGFRAFHLHRSVQLMDECGLSKSFLLQQLCADFTLCSRQDYKFFATDYGSEFQLRIEKLPVFLRAGLSLKNSLKSRNVLFFFPELSSLDFFKTAYPTDYEKYKLYSDNFEKLSVFQQLLEKDGQKPEDYADFMTAELMLQMSVDDFKRYLTKEPRIHERLSIYQNV